MSARKGWRAWIGSRLRLLAEQIDRPGTPKLIGWSFTFETGEGIRFREDRRGCRLAYLDDDEYRRAHDESDSDASETARNVWVADAAVDLLGPDGAREINERMGLPPEIVDALRDLEAAQRALAAKAERVRDLEASAREARK